jgi:hypothetical protein
MMFERSTKVLYSLCRYCLADSRRGIPEQPIVRKTPVRRLALRRYSSIRGGGMFDSGRQHVQGHRKGGEPRDQAPKEQAGHQDGSAPPRAACPRCGAGGRALPVIKLCL